MTSIPVQATNTIAVRRGELTLASFVRCGGMFIVVTMLYSAFATWGWDAGRVPLPPSAFMLLVIASAGAASLLDGARGITGALLTWGVANAVLAMAGFLWSSGSDVALQEVRTRVMSSMLLVSIGILLADANVRRFGRLLIAVSMLVAVAMNVWEITHPLTFSMALGRSAGFYVNPNISGAAIVGGMLLALPVVPARFREPFVLIAGVGVLATLSRGALLCWMLSTILLAVFRGVRAPRIALISVGAVFAGMSLAATLLASGQLKYIGGGAEQFVKRRLSIGSSEQFNADVSASSRTHLLARALEMFGERPLTGHGTGATVEWHELESTHNIYARQLAEYGVFGAWLAPTILLFGWLAARRPAKADDSDADDSGTARAAAKAFMIFAACWGLFSHNVLDDVFLLTGIALIVVGRANQSWSTPRESSV